MLGGGARLRGVCGGSRSRRLAASLGTAGTVYGSLRSVLQAAGRSKARGCWGQADSGAINSPAKVLEKKEGKIWEGGLSRVDLIRHKRSSGKMAVQQQQRWGGGADETVREVMKFRLANEEGRLQSNLQMR